MKLAIVTFLQKGETLSANFPEAVEYLRKNLDLEIECFLSADETCAARETDNPVFSRIFLRSESTKYLRLREILGECETDWILSVDSDVTLEPSALCAFLEKCTREDADAGWGFVACRPSKPLVSKLVEADKILSHRWLRPLLWKLRLGITIPGQIMLLKRTVFLPAFSGDTFLDDLAFGIFLRLHPGRKRIVTERTVLGFEAPSASWHQLFSQRRRWAKGFASLLKSESRFSGRFFLMIHALAYHAAVPAVMILCFFLCLFESFSLALLLLLLGAFIFCGGSIRLLPAALIYPFVFSILHLWWGMWVFFCLIRRNLF